MAAYLKDKFYYKVNAVNKILVMVEQEPLTESCIMLDKERDQFDMPKASIHWEISYKTWQTVVETSTLLKKEIERLDFGRVAIHPHVNPENNDWERYLSDVNHHMGGTRLSSVASGGVVDKNLQVWDVPNLYVCSSSVFPTSSHSNPTLTLLALGVRLSNYLIKEKQL